MPLVRVELFERRLTPELESRLIDRLTEALLDALEAPELKDHTWVIVKATTRTAGARRQALGRSRLARPGRPVDDPTQFRARV
jgi:phenylpyruvate tautomerase PptA (4-oxalocrotonate tautomerase family)